MVERALVDHDVDRGFHLAAGSTVGATVHRAHDQASHDVVAEIHDAVVEPVLIAEFEVDANVGG
jgi:hypothetical protein